MTDIDPNVASSDILARQLPDLATSSFVREAVVELAQEQPDGFLLKEWTRLDTHENRHRDNHEAGSCLDILLSK